ncbi:conserved hypothetical protein [Hahella chejuensis KCTC 2396]|uniref:DUF3052 domain-containing protein n=1 Tax=Hahella chejuensis (strain KCTC 2396) TaxID=349521 RepID=Q2SAR7_HAHCH|nr:DUF3052 family protein [Hahella chejuensis]ABC32257.1 conserved hypothetical protein [Hahella chejuensis KCTC 2396]
MAGYSKNPLSKKLGVKEGFVLYPSNAPADYPALVSPLPDNVLIVDALRPDLDMIHFFTKSRDELEAELGNLADHIKQNGMIWISWPKKASKVKTDMTEDEIRRIALPMGLVDVKVCAVDEVWSGLKLVIRRENRK